MGCVMADVRMRPSRAEFEGSLIILTNGTSTRFLIDMPNDDDAKLCAVAMNNAFRRARRPGE